MAVRNGVIIGGVLIGSCLIALRLPWIEWRASAVGLAVVVTAAVYGYINRRRIS